MPPSRRPCRRGPARQGPGPATGPRVPGSAADPVGGQAAPPGAPGRPAPQPPRGLTAVAGGSGP
eukprot:8049883-Alexandrium_andersonii.AAC.1